MVEGYVVLCKGDCNLPGTGQLGLGFQHGRCASLFPFGLVDLCMVQ